MRRTPSRRLLAAALLVASVLAPMATMPATAAPATGIARHDQDDFPRHGLGPELTERDSYVRIGSETKTFTVRALLELVDEGRIGLDDPIATYVKGVPDGHRITLRQLAGMRSGLFPYTADADFTHDLLSDPERHFSPREVPPRTASGTRTPSGPARTSSTPTPTSFCSAW